MAASSERADLDVTMRPLLNYNEMKKALKEVDPDVRKEMDKTIRGFINPVAQIAKGYIRESPLSGWNKREGSTKLWGSTLAWDQAAIKRGISVRQGKRRPKGVPATESVTAWGIYNRSPAGMIYELAGKRSSGETPAGRTFVQVLTERGHRPSRLIWRAFTEHGGGAAITRDVARTIEQYESQLGHRLS